MGYKMKGFSGFGNSPAKQKVDPDAPGTKGKPGYEPPVKRSDLDTKGKAIWDKKHAKQQGPQQKSNLDLQKGEMEGTRIYKGDKKFDRKAKGYKFPTTQNKAERITDYEDRAEFAKHDAESAQGKQKKQHLATAKKLQREADIIRDRKSDKKKNK